MNAEISKIRRIRNYKEAINREPTRIKDERLNEMVYQLNGNISALYAAEHNGKLDIDYFASLFMANIYIILNMFNEMGIYPDYFYDQIVKMNIEYKQLIQNNNDLRGNYRLFNEINLSARVTEAIKGGLEKGYYRVQAYKKKDLNDAFLEMIGFFQAFGIPYNVYSDEQCLKVFNDIKFNHLNIVERLLNSDFIFEDIEFLARLLFEYMTFFAAMGINPKEYFDKYIDSLSGKHK